MPKRRSRIQVVRKSCRRCGKPVFGIDRPIHASQATYAKWQGICEDCVSADEENQVLHEIGADFVGASLPASTSNRAGGATDA